MSREAPSPGNEDAPKQETDAPAEDDAPPTPLPADAAAWRAFLATVPARDLVRFVQQDKTGFSRLLSGFRLSGETVRHPVVVQRLVEEAAKNPKFGELLGGLRPRAPHPAATPPDAMSADAPATSKPSSVKPASAASATAAESPTLKETVKRQRTALKEKEARVAALEAQVTALTRERDAARAEAEAATAARRTAEAEAERQRRQRERDTRRGEARRESEPTPKEKAIVIPVGPSPALPPPRPFEEAVTRLLNRGKYETAAEVCEEALQTEAAASGAALAGRVHTLYASALYGMGRPGAEEQDRLAVTRLLDGGRVVEAAQVMARLLTRAHDIKQGDSATLRRLQLLAERTGEHEAVQDVFRRMRIASAESGRRLRAALAAGGRKGTSLLSGVFEAPEGTIVLSADEPLALPVSDGEAAAVTPRRLARAVDGGEAAFVQSVRTGLAALRRRGGQDARLADALLEALTALEPAAVAPLLADDTRPILVDASNVARHNPDPLSLSPTPRVANLLLMRDYLLRQGFFPVTLIADATLRFHVDDRAAYQSLVDRHVIRETPPGTAADEALLIEARARRAPLVTNDRFAEWGEAARNIERLGFVLTPGRVALTSV